MKERLALSKLSPYVPGVLIPGKIKLASNENTLGPSPLALKAFSDSLMRMHQYPEASNGRLKSALSKKWQLNPENFIIGNGSDEVMVMTALAFLNEGDHILVGQNTFSEYRFSALLMNAEVEKVPMPDLCFDLKLFRLAIKSHTKIIFLCSPNNPTGTFIPKAELIAFLKDIPEHILVCFDAAYAEFVDDFGYPEDKFLIETFPNIIIFHTYSKIYGLAGMRVGYAISRPDIIHSIEKTRQPFNINLGAQEAAIAALDDEAFFQKSRELAKEGREFIYELCENLGLSYLKSQANFVCIDLEHDAKEVFELIADYGVTIRPLASFGLPNHIRVTTGTTEELMVFAQCLRKALDKIRNS